MGQDEAGTLAALNSLRTELIDPAIAEHTGRVFKSTGDGLLAEFPSVVSAVSCAVAIQNDMQRHNQNVPEDKAIKLRIGINLGDIIVEGDDMFGDGVNVAARLESIAPPGGVAVSATVRDHLGARLDLHFEDLGEQMLKNIDRPVRVYVIGGGARSGLSYPSLPDKPSIAVLPLTNMSGDPGQQYFIDGFTEDIITELARARQIHVLSRNSSFQYAGKSVDAVKVGRELGVQYLLEGSIRRVGNNVRITAQLIDTATGNHVWAERFDRNQEDIFAVQDQVVRRIVSTLAGRVQAAYLEKAKRKPPANLSAYECVVQADALPFDDPEAAPKARELYRRAIELDPNYARAHALLGLNIRHEWLRDMSGSSEALDEAYALMKKAISLDENDSLCHEVMAWVQVGRGSYDLAEHHYEKAAELNPSRAVTVAGKGSLLTVMGKPEEGLELLKEARQLDPFFNPSWYWREVGTAHFLCRRYQDAITAIKRTTNLSYSAHAYLAACYAFLEQLSEAQNHARDVMRLLPSFVSSRFTAKQEFKRPEDRQHLHEGLRKAGLPD
jgi:TolB-like protein/tetratricopeptide (TPR) repeat protein